MISGYIQQGITLYIAINLLRNPSSNLIGIYGIVLVLLFVWFLLRRIGLIPAI